MLNHKIKQACFGLLSVSLIFSTLSCSREEIINRGIGAAIGAGVGLIQAQTITPEAEIKLGAEVRKQTLQEYKLYSGSANLVNYVRTIGQKVASKAKLRDRYNFQFDVLDSTEINAFAIPGGNIFVTTELLKYLHNEAELASVLGHEISHVDAEHTKESIRRALIAQGVVQGGLSDSQLLAAAASISFDLILKGFSREQEKEADRLGVVLATDQHYDEDAMTGFLKTLLDTEGNSSNGLVNLLRTHPGTEERIALLNTFIDQNKLHPANPVLNAEAYQKAIAVLPAKVPVSSGARSN